MSNESLIKSLEAAIESNNQSLAAIDSYLKKWPIHEVHDKIDSAQAENRSWFALLNAKLDNMMKEKDSVKN